MSLDLQVNGYLGTDFSSDTITAKAFRCAAEKYLKDGANSFLPTIITSSVETYKRNLLLFSKIIDETPALKQNLPGFHLEGPFISKKPGAVGAHNPDWTKKPSIDFLKQLIEWADGKIKLLTISAECDGADKLCTFAVQKGITVSLGHQLAGFEEIDHLYNSGATMLTHLGNGMPNTVNRHNNPLLCGIMHPGLTPMLIADGFHIPPWLIKGIIKYKGSSNVVMVSDASPIAGLAPGEYNTLGNRVVLEKNGLLHNPEKKCLVGSSCTMKKLTQFLKEDCGVSAEEVQVMCTENPERKIG